MTTHILTQDELKSQLHYDPLTGIFKRLIANNHAVSVNDVAGCLKSGYIRIMVLGKRYRAHRLAWLYMTGKWPNHEIDHINSIKDDNRFCNLRDCTHTENVRNTSKTKLNKTGYKGVCFNKDNKKYNAQLGLNGKNYNLGYFETPEQAAQAYKSFAQQHHGEFYRE